MRGPRRALLGLWSAAGLLTAGAAGTWIGNLPRRTRPRWDVPATLSLPVSGDSTMFAAAAVRVRTRDPFRLDRRPTTLRFNPWALLGPPAPAPRPTPPRPVLTLAGIVGGPPWSALIEGIPGRESGALLSVGDSVSGIRLLGIRGDTARLAGFDTTWTLTPRQVWR